MARVPHPLNFPSRQLVRQGLLMFPIYFGIGALLRLFEVMSYFDPLQDRLLHYAVGEAGGIPLESTWRLERMAVRPDLQRQCLGSECLRYEMARDCYRGGAFTLSSQVHDMGPFLIVRLLTLLHSMSMVITH